MLNSKPETAATHPTPKQLQALFGGEPLEAGLVSWIEQHLMDCVACQHSASEVQPGELERLIQQNAGSKFRQLPKLGNGYEIVEEIGRGASGIVYRAIDRALDRTVALKVLVSGARAKPSELVRFQRESEALARMNHPHVVRVFDIGEQDGVPFLAMEWIDGNSLAEYLHLVPVSSRQAAEIVAALACGISHAHGHRVLHRDLKPQNVLVANHDAGDSSGTTSADQIAVRLKIIDFGLARFCDEDGFHTRTGETLGTPAYMAPEQIAGDPMQIQPATDVYGLGAILYECLAGRPPFHSNSPLETMQLVANHEPVPVQELRPGVPSDLAIICHRCLEKSPAARFTSAAELAADLQRFLNGEPIQSRAVSRLERGLRWARRNPWPIAAILLLVSAIVSTIVGQQIFQNRLSQERDTVQSNYQSARATVWQMLEASGNESAFDIPRLQQMQVRQMSEALKLFESLAQQEGTEQSKFDLAKIQMLYGTSLVAGGNFDDGRKLLEQSLDHFQQRAKLSPEDQSAMGLLVVNQVKLAYSLNAAGNVDESIQVLESTLTLATQLSEQKNPDLPNTDLVAWTQHSLGNSLVAKERYERAAAAYEAAIGLREQELRNSPDNDELLRFLAESQICLGRCQMNTDGTKAEATFQHAIESLNLIRQRHPHDMPAIISTAVALLNRSNILAHNGNLDGAIALCTEGIELLQGALNAEPDNFSAKSYQSMLFGNRALFKSQNHQAVDAIGDWELAIQFSVDAKTRFVCQVNLVRELANLSRIESAIAEASRIDCTGLPNDQKFQVTAAWGVILNADNLNHNPNAPTQSTNQEKCMKPIVQLLADLAEAGWFATEKSAREDLLNGPDFATLREVGSVGFVEKLLSGVRVE